MSRADGSSPALSPEVQTIDDGKDADAGAVQVYGGLREYNVGIIPDEDQPQLRTG